MLISGISGVSICSCESTEQTITAIFGTPNVWQGSITSALYVWGVRYKDSTGNHCFPLYVGKAGRSGRYDSKAKEPFDKIKNYLDCSKSQSLQVSARMTAAPRGVVFYSANQLIYITKDSKGVTTTAVVNGQYTSSSGKTRQCKPLSPEAVSSGEDFSAFLTNNVNDICYWAMDTFNADMLEPFMLANIYFPINQEDACSMPNGVQKCDAVKTKAWFDNVIKTISTLKDLEIQFSQKVPGSQLYSEFWGAVGGFDAVLKLKNPDYDKKLDDFLKAKF